MRRLRLGIFVLAVLVGGWMVVDAIHALYTGNYFSFNGQIGPWAAVLGRAHLNPDSLPVKLLFLALGALYIIVALDYGRNDLRSEGGIAAIAILTLWYIPFGAICSLIVLVLLGIESKIKPPAKIYD
ncbi:MAG: hypothetical protein JO165_13765 [Candidatus Eremiobacteraeota bacterium]|nr:hypothetical protein [Candidatus Eremiobacteraeota bacterium]